MKKILTFIFVALSGIIPYGNTATVNAANLATLISNALSGKVYGDTVTVTLDAGIAYELESVAAAGLVNLIINGNGATVTLGKNGQLTAQQSLILNGINFNCAAGEKELVALDGNPDNVLWCENEPWLSKYLSKTNGKKVYFNEGTIAFNNCKVASLKKSLFGLVNSKSWALKELIIDGSIIQLDYNSGNAPISMEGSGGNNIIKDILFQNSTFYNVKSNALYFLRYNRSGGAAQPEKIYTSTTLATWKMFNNTFALNGTGSAKFANNYTSTSKGTLTWKNNVFFKTDQLNKAKGSCVLGFKNTDNALEGNGISGDKSAYGTEDNTCISIPTEAFDFDASKLLDAFCLYKNSYAFKNSMGDPRWLTKSKEFKKTVSARKLATMCWPYAVKIPTNVKAYIATQNEGENAVTLVKLTEGQIPANTGVIVYSDITAATTYEFEPTKYSGTQDLTGNCLKGVVKETLYSEVEETGKTNYALMPPATDDGSSLEFRPVTSGSYAANTAYLQLSSSASKISFNFDDEATGIESLSSNSSTEGKENMYNLQGVRVNENYKGIVIKNGKKHLKQ